MFRVCDSKKRKRIRSLMVFVSVVTMGICLSACGQEKEHVTSLSINKDGEVVSTIYETFGEDYYSVDELADMAASEISYYNSEYISPKITVEDPEVLEEEKLVKLTMTYKTAYDYSHFNQATLFYGTVQEAAEAGFKVSDALVGADGETITDEKLSDMSEKHVIITSDKIKIEAPYEIVYMSKGVTRKGKKEAILSETTADNVQLLLSK